MRRLKLLAALLWAGTAASAQIAPVARPLAPLGAAPAAAAASAVPAPALGAPLLAPSLAAPLPVSPSVSAPSAAAAEALAAPAAELAATENGLIMAPDVAAGLAALRRASHPLHAEVERLVAAIKAVRPELPISAENLFLVRDRVLLRALNMPEHMAGAARIVTDGRREVPVVILEASRGVTPDDFVERSVHEAIHLMDGGIMRVRFDEDLKHLFAEGWTQARTLKAANEILAALGRPPTADTAYAREIALVQAFAAKHGTAALDELVRTGSDAGLRAALGGRFDLAGRLAGARAPREKRVNALIGLVNADAVGAGEESYLLDYVGRARWTPAAPN